MYGVVYLCKYVVVQHTQNSGLISIYKRTLLLRFDSVYGQIGMTCIIINGRNSSATHTHSSQEVNHRVSLDLGLVLTTRQLWSYMHVFLNCTKHFLQGGTVVSGLTSFSSHSETPRKRKMHTLTMARDFMVKLSADAGRVDKGDRSQSHPYSGRTKKYKVGMQLVNTILSNFKTE